MFPIIGRGRFIYFKEMIGLGVLQDRARLLVWMTLCYRVTNIAYRLLVLCNYRNYFSLSLEVTVSSGIVPYRK